MATHDDIIKKCNVEILSDLIKKVSQDPFAPIVPNIQVALRLGKANDHTSSYIESEAGSLVDDPFDLDFDSGMEAFSDADASYFDQFLVYDESAVEKVALFSDDSESETGTTKKDKKERSVSSKVASIPHAHGKENEIWTSAPTLKQRAALPALVYTIMVVIDEARDLPGYMKATWASRAKKLEGFVHFADFVGWVCKNVIVYYATMKISVIQKKYLHLDLLKRLHPLQIDSIMNTLRRLGMVSSAHRILGETDLPTEDFGPDEMKERKRVVSDYKLTKFVMPTELIEQKSRSSRWMTLIPEVESRSLLPDEIVSLLALMITNRCIPEWICMPYGLETKKKPIRDISTFYGLILRIITLVNAENNLDLTSKHIGLLSCEIRDFLPSMMKDHLSDVLLSKLTQ